MTKDAKSILIGATVSFVALLLGFFLMGFALRDSRLPVRITVYLRQPGPLVTDAKVQLAGRTVGRVLTIRLVRPDIVHDANHPLHPFGGVAIDIGLANDFSPWIWQNSEFLVNPNGVRGQAYLEVGPPPSDEELGKPLQDGDIVRGIDPVRMEDIIVTGFFNTQRLMSLFRELNEDASTLGANLAVLRNTIQRFDTGEFSYAEVLESLAEAQRNLDKVAPFGKAIPLDPIRREIHLVQGHLETDLHQLWKTVDVLEKRYHEVRDLLPPDPAKAVQKLLATTRHTRQTVRTIRANIETIRQTIASGEGTVGALLNDPEFSDDAKQVGRYIKRHPWELLLRPKVNR